MTPEQKGEIVNSILIILIFALVALVPFYWGKIAEIKKNWVKYRCDPRVMPFAWIFGHDTTQNFIQCAQQIQGGVMDEMLLPVNFNISQVTQNIGGIGDAVQDMRKVVNQTRGFMGEITSSIFGIFLNITLQFEYMAVKIKDIVGKLAGMTAAMMYIMTGGVKVGQSVANGPIVGMLRSTCFKPDTQVELQTGAKIPMCDVLNGHILKGGSIVQGTLQLANVRREPFYRLHDVMVTGEHKVRDDTTRRFIAVKDHPDSAETDVVAGEVVCLITSDHLIRIGTTTFWDWED